MAAAADPASELVQLGDAEPIGREHHHHRRIGHVDADFDHCRSNECIHIAGSETSHRVLLGRRGHAAVQQPDSQTGQRTGDQIFMHPFSRLRIQALALGDQWAHHIGLPARFDLGAHS